MHTKQKIKNLIIIVSVMTILAITCVFYKTFNNFIYNFAFDKLNIVTIENNLLVHYINVGQGDAIAINFPNGKTMLIDAGTKENSVTYTKYIKEKVMGNSHSNKIDYLILTHADADHVGGALRLIQKFDIGTVCLPFFDSNTETYVELKNYVLENCNYKYISSNLTFEDTGCEISVFGPLQLEDDNDTCPVIKVEYKDKSFLFTGDVSVGAEVALMRIFGEELDCDVLKVAHHGSDESTGKEFLNATTPEHAVISVGGNSYGHPTEEVLTRLEDENVNVLRTDKNGNILFVIGNNYELKHICEKFYITNLTLDYRIWILGVEIGLTIMVAVVIFKKQKQT